ncbi:B3 domain-containing protein At5g24050-like [Corylus avellana]|uniref:B3 domain-containing protein At5g24050-like n=1 Tax=Corylus avellana TaxID=13451 RepID=UPI001E227AEF|nr:B3 domain-containing protein At5g24050-like [Corylus avellana]
MEAKGLLSLKDVEGIHADPTNLSEFEKLVLVAEVASSKHEAQEKEEKKSKIRKKANHSIMRSTKRQKLNMGTLPKPQPVLPEEIKKRINAMGGTQEDMVIEKALYRADVKLNNNRLSMPFGQAKEGFLTKEESAHLAKPKENIIVPFIEPSGRYAEMTLGQWDMPKKSGKTSSMYVLKTNWNRVKQANRLEKNDVVQVWSFRVGTEQQLCLALVVVSSSGGNHGGRDGGEAEEDAGTSYKAN